jgi:chromosome segregation ATPase
MTALEACALLADAVRDLSIARARIADLEGERDTLRELLRAALDELTTLTTRVNRQTETIAHLHDALRPLRGEAAA